MVNFTSSHIVYFLLSRICDKCQKAKFRTLDEAEEHEKTCDGTFDPDSVPPMAVVQHKGQAKKDSENEEWWRSFAERAEKSDLNIRAIEHGGKIVMLLQIIGERRLLRWYSHFFFGSEH